MLQNFTHPRVNPIMIASLALLLLAGISHGESSKVAKAQDPPSSVFHGSRDYKIIALTYDDGPNSRFTPGLVEVLKKHKVPATFFWLGEQVERYPEQAKLVAEAGFEIANHTYDHSNPKKMSSAKLREQISSTQKLIEDTTGVTPTLFRPPYGAVNKDIRRLLSDMDLTNVMWSLDTEDWRSGCTKDDIVARVMTNIKSGDIILMHDRNSRTTQATDELIPLLRKQGYIFVTVSDLIKAPEVDGKVKELSLLSYIKYAAPATKLICH
jgi:peptidoglycan/xylan/chitin deacetylase (PgdA/CDA1 family)